VWKVGPIEGGFCVVPPPAIRRQVKFAVVRTSSSIKNSQHETKSDQRPPYSFAIYLLLHTAEAHHMSAKKTGEIKIFAIPTSRLPSAIHYCTTPGTCADFFRCPYKLWDCSRFQVLIRPWMRTYFACNLSFRKVNDSFGPGIHALYLSVQHWRSTAMQWR
jgi:hypothetical protein